MNRYLEVVRRVAHSHAHAKTAQPAKTGPTHTPQFSQNSQFSRSRELLSTLGALEARCPEYVEVVDWIRAVADGQVFLGRWAEQAAALGWTQCDLFGLHPVPKHPHPSYRQLSRYDKTGLVWLLRGRPVIAMTVLSAAIQCQSGSVLMFYRVNTRLFSREDEGL